MMNSANRQLLHRFLKSIILSANNAIPALSLISQVDMEAWVRCLFCLTEAVERITLMIRNVLVSFEGLDPEN